MREWRDIRKGQSTLRNQSSVCSITIQQERTLDKVLIAFHKAQMYCVKDLITMSGWDLREYKHLPNAVRKAVTHKEYSSFCQHLLGLSSWLLERLLL